MNQADTSDHPERSEKTRSPRVFFDGACPLCSREIIHYRKLKGAESIDWIDVSAMDYEEDLYHLERHTAMARFHVMDKNGQWQTGAWGFAELWSHLAGYRWLSVLVRRLKLLPLLDRIYTKFALWRVRRDCTAETCKPVKK